MGAEEDAAARRERLLALRAAKELLSTPDDAPAPAPADEHRNDNRDSAEDLPAPVEAPDEAVNQSVSPAEEFEEVEEDGDMPMVKFRNYLPHDEKLRGGKVAPVSLPKFEDPVATETAEPKQLENPFGNIAPKNPNWDLKRDAQKRLDKLEKRTQKALAEIALEQQREREALEGGRDAVQD